VGLVGDIICIRTSVGGPYSVFRGIRWRVVIRVFIIAGWNARSQPFTSAMTADEIVK
jgi:hypothetical protein